MSKPQEQLEAFISRARAAGKSDAEARDALLKAGWDEMVVAGSLVPTGGLVPPPPPAPKSSGREIFFYLLQFITLGIVATSLGGVIFAAIDRYLPSEVVGPYYVPPYSPVPWPLASLIVVAPVFFLVSRSLVRDVVAGRTSAMSKIRRLLIYLALFLASATIIGDLIALVYRFLAGEVTLRFMLKVVVILAIGGWVVAYYFATVRRDERKQGYPRQWHLAHGIVFGAVMVVAVVVGFILNGTPIERQKLVRDSQRVAELQGLSWQVQAYYERQGELPASLTDLGPGYVPQEPKDPLTGEQYRYQLGQGLGYQLCAVFETDDKQAMNRARTAFPEPVGVVNWTHPAGEHCFSLAVTPRVPPAPPTSPSR